MKSEPMGICTVCGKAFPKSEMRIANGQGLLICVNCGKSQRRKYTERIHDKELKSIAKTVERIKSGETSGVTRTDVLNELKFAIDGFVSTWKAITTEHSDIVQADKSIESEAHDYLVKRFVEETI